MLFKDVNVCSSEIWVVDKFKKLKRSHNNNTDEN
jgi:hypothetical protein